MKLEDYCEYVERNRVPSTRFYVDEDGSMYNQLGKVI